ncbi:MAG: hypothetical protein AAGA30_00835, partial [Planctomycetota bacterium]
LALAVVVQRFDEFVSPLNGILATKNLVFFGASFIALKILHEFGHGYACKKFGGRVPEMGCKLIVMMPLAYVDATSAWSFPDRNHRLVVMLAGMYIEAIVAILGVFIWAFFPHSFIGSCAFQLIFMAGVATVLFNANPLMKYDGYFILSDVIGIPNLRSRSSNYMYAVLKKVFFGIEITEEVEGSDRFTFLTYGICATIYSTVLTVSIAFMIASMFGFLGLLMGLVQVGNMAWKSINKFFNFLLMADETAHVRFRGQVIAVLFAVGAPTVIGFCPVPGRIAIPGITSGSDLISVRSPAEGFVTEILDPKIEYVDAEEPLIRIRNIGVENEYAVQKINTDMAIRKALLVSREDPSEGKKLEAEAREMQSKLNVLKKEADQLTICSPQAGKVMYLLDQQTKGTLLKAGEVVAKIGAGHSKVRGWVSEEQLANCNINLDDKIELRFADLPGQTFYGNINCLAPAKRDSFEDLSLTTMGDGGIKINPETGQTEENMYMLVIEVDELNADETRLDSRVTIVLKRRYQSLATWVMKSMRRFAGQLEL